MSEIDSRRGSLKRYSLLSARPHQFGLVHVQSESAGGHPLLDD